MSEPKSRLPSANTAFDHRRQVTAFGLYQLQLWSERREIDLERIGPAPDRTIERIRARDARVDARITATHDRFGDPLLTRTEMLTDMAKTTLTIERIVADLPRDHRTLIRALYLEKRKKGEIAAMLGVDANHLTHMLHDAQYAVGSTLLVLGSVNDERSLQERMA